MTSEFYACIVRRVAALFARSRGSLCEADRDDIVSQVAELAWQRKATEADVDKLVVEVMRRTARGEAAYRRMVAAHQVDAFGNVTLVEFQPNPERDAQIVAAVKAADGSIPEAAKAIGVSRDTVERHLHKAAPRKPRGGARPGTGGARAGAGRPRKNHQSRVSYVEGEERKAA